MPIVMMAFGAYMALTNGQMLWSALSKGQTTSRTKIELSRGDMAVGYWVLVAMHALAVVIGIALVIYFGAGFV
jgi:predicted Zn-dependent protease